MKKSERLNQELIYLSNKHEFHLKDLIEAFNISKRTALRDIEELENMGLSIYVESGRYGGYKIINQNLLTPIYFNNNEILAIFFALKSLDALSSTPFQKSYKDIREKLFATLSHSSKENISRTIEFIHYYNPYPISQFNYLSDILYSIMYEKVINANYIQFQNRALDIQVYELFYRNGIWFIEGYDLLKREWGVYRCDYLRDLVVNENSEMTISRTQLKTLKLAYEQDYRDIEYKCELTEDGVESFNKNHYPNMDLTYINEVPHIIGKYNNEELNYMVRYLISFGEHVTIIYPDQLKDAYLDTLKSIVERYQ